MQHERTIRILVQTTIPRTADDWSVARFALLTEHLASRPGVEVTARDREAGPGGDDPLLASLDRAPFDELWLLAVDSGDGLSDRDCEGISRFRQRGGAILSARDHHDLGSSLCRLGGIGAAHYFHSRNLEPDLERHAPDDVETPSISWPNYHSGHNGDYQHVLAIAPVHELLRYPGSSRAIELFPAHPHEGAVGAPAGDASARVAAQGTSATTGHRFNLLVAFERSRDAHGNVLGRGVAHSSFHHLADYNWDTSRGAPSFVTEPTGDGVRREPQALADIKQYVTNAASWLASA